MVEIFKIWEREIMAIWQYTFFILPKDSNFNYPQLLKDEEGLFDDSIFWEGCNFKCEFFSQIESFLPKTKSWSKNILIYGDLESNVLEAQCEKNKIIGASFRINFTSEYEDILRELIEFFILNGFVVLDENLNEVPLNFESFKSIMESSPQLRTYNLLLGSQNKNKEQ